MKMEIKVLDGDVSDFYVEADIEISLPGGQQFAFRGGIYSKDGGRGVGILQGKTDELEKFLNEDIPGDEEMQNYCPIVNAVEDCLCREATRLGTIRICV